MSVNLPPNIHTHTHTQPSSPSFYPPKILPLDLSDVASIAGKAQEAVDAFGRIDILVNNAGVSSRGSVMETDIAVDRRVMEVNFFGTVALTKGEGWSGVINTNMLPCSVVSVVSEHVLHPSSAPSDHAGPGSRSHSGDQQPAGKDRTAVPLFM